MINFTKHAKSIKNYFNPTQKIISYTALFLLTGILFSSCGTHLTIKKRVYRNGYYISTTSNNNGNVTTDDSKIETQTDHAEVKTTLSVQPNKDVASIAKNESQTQESVGIVPSSEITEKSKNPVLNPEQGKMSDDIKQNNRLTKQKIKNTIQQIGKNDNLKDHSDGLSLFWIVILVILILWAIGFIGGSVGSLINLLLLVALILLILWLLRVI